TLSALAGPHHPHLAQGVAFAAQARERAGNLAPYTDQACRIVCDMPAEDAARLTDVALRDLPADGVLPAYEVWRQRIQAHWIKAEPFPAGRAGPTGCGVKASRRL